MHLNPLSGRWMADASHLQRHIGAAIAFNIWQYYQATEDTDFLVTYGAEMIFEIARFWASIATYDPDLDRYEIVGVMGPDEYHDGYVGADGARPQEQQLHERDGGMGARPGTRSLGDPS